MAANRRFTSQFSLSQERQPVELMSVFTQEAIGTQASLVDQGVTYTAKRFTPVGDSITIALINTGTPSQALTIDVSGDAISVDLALDAGVKALLAVQDLTYTADLAGTAGNGITIQYVGDGVAGAETVDVTLLAIVVHMDPTAVTGSTATQIKAAVDASVAASALISVAITGTAGNVQAVAAATPLATGAQPLITTTAAQLITALNLDVDASALITASGAGASPLTALAATPLAGGVETEMSQIASKAGMTLVQLAVGVYEIELDNSYAALMSPVIKLQRATAVDLTPQMVSADTQNNSVIFRMLAGATPTNLADADVLIIGLTMRNSANVS